MEPEIVGGGEPDEKKGGFNWLGLILVIVIFGIIAVIALPGFIPSGARKGRQSEAKTNLASIFITQVSYLADNSKFGHTFKEIEWTVEQSNPKYVYFLSPTEYLGRPLDELGLKTPVDFKTLGGVVPGVSANGFTAIAIGNIDSDGDLDVWSVNDQKVIKPELNDI